MGRNNVHAQGRFRQMRKRGFPMRCAKPLTSANASVSGLGRPIDKPWAARA